MKLYYDEETAEIVMRVPYKKGDHSKYAHSSTGKSRMIATTKGATQIMNCPDPLVANLSIYFTLPPAEWGPNLAAQKAAHKKAGTAGEGTEPA